MGAQTAASCVFRLEVKHRVFHTGPWTHHLEWSKRNPSFLTHTGGSAKKTSNVKMFDNSSGKKLGKKNRPTSQARFSPNVNHMNFSWISGQQKPTQGLVLRHWFYEMISIKTYKESRFQAVSRWWRFSKFFSFSPRNFLGEDVHPFWRPYFEPMGWWKTTRFGTFDSWEAMQSKPPIRASSWRSAIFDLGRLGWTSGGG